MGDGEFTPEELEKITGEVKQATNYEEKRIVANGEGKDLKAIRYNKGKPRIGLLPPELLEEVAKVMTFGAEKYAEDNWKKGLSDECCLSSCLRHITAYMRGEEFDNESGLPHLAHAACNLAFMLHFHYSVKRNNNNDCPYIY